MAKVLLCPEDQKPCTCTGERYNDGRLKCPREGIAPPNHQRVADHIDGYDRDVLGESTVTE